MSRGQLSITYSLYLPQRETKPQRVKILAQGPKLGGGGARILMPNKNISMMPFACEQLAGWSWYFLNGEKPMCLAHSILPLVNYEQG